MDLSQEIFTRIYSTHREVDRWLREGRGGEGLKAKMVKLRREVIELNKLYEETHHQPLTKTLSAVRFFTGDTLELINQVNTQIKVIHRRSFERWWVAALKFTSSIALKRLEMIHPERHASQTEMFTFKGERNETLEKIHGLMNPGFVEEIFSKWCPFDVMLDKCRNHWCFVFTPPNRFISGVMDDFTRNRPHQLSWCLEYAFREQLGVSTPALDGKDGFEENDGWVYYGGSININRHEMETRFKSYRDI